MFRKYCPMEMCVQTTIEKVNIFNNAALIIYNFSKAFHSMFKNKERNATLCLKLTKAKGMKILQIRLRFGIII